MSILLVPFTFYVFYFLSMIFLISCLCIIEPVQNLRVSLWPCKSSLSRQYFFLFSFTSLSSFFTHIEKNQRVGGAKTGVSGEKPLDTPANRTWLVPHVTRAPSEARTHSGESQ